MNKVLVSVWNDFWGVHLCEGLVRAGYDVTYDHTGGKKARGARDIRNWPAAFLNHAAFKGWLNQSFAFALSRRIVDSKATLLCKKYDAFWGWSGCSLKALRLAKARGIPALLERGSTHCEWQREVVHAQFQRFGVSDLFHYPQSQIAYDKAEYETADRICVPSQFVAATFYQKDFTRDKVSINPYGVDVNFWSQSKPNFERPSPFTFLYVASIGLRKGIADLLEAWKLANLHNARLVIIGGVSAEAIPLLKCLPPNVEIRGFTPHAEIRALMSQSHAYILPSFEEGLARSVLEAAAAGLPPIISKETGATDILKEGRDCWVIPSGQPETIAKVLRDVAAQPDEAQRRGANASFAVKQFTWEAYGDRCADLLSSII
jgi:glycosyltransferase involved in cell wall biosynthesis